MKGYIYITSSGFDPEKGKDLKDPFLGPIATLGGCMPNIRRHVVVGDRIFVISGRIRGHSQYVIGGLEVAEIIDPLSAYERFPEQRLHKSADGLIRGNVLVLPDGTQHPLDNHPTKTFSERVKNYIVGRNPLVLRLPEEIARGREETVSALRRIMGKNGTTPIEIIGRWSKLDEHQVSEMSGWLQAIKQGNAVAPAP